jgi:hypothetical protein
MLLTGWTLYILVTGLYFPKKVAIVMEKKDLTGIESKMERVKESKDIRSHFHNIDKSIFVEEKDPPLCLTCHGNMPHTKALEMRSLINMHTYFIACEVCHVRKDEEADVFFAWIDFDTKKKIFTLKGPSGNYNAKIVPILKDAQGNERRLDVPLNEEYASEFIQSGYKWSLEQKAKAKAIIHEEHTKKPILCNECHAKNGYMPFEDLHYSQKRVEQLEGTEAAGMVENYIKFYLPTMFDPSLVRKRRLSAEKTKGASK